jgi:MFS family permease
VTLLWLIPWLLVSKPHWRGYAHGSGNNVPVRQVMRNPIVWAMGIGHFCNTYGFYFLLAWLPLFLVKVRHLSILEMTGMMTTTYLVQGFGALAWGWLSDRLVMSGWDEGSLRKGLLCLYQFVGAAAILGIGLSTTPNAIFGWLLFGAVFYGIGGTSPYAMSQVYAGPEAAGTWVGVMNGVGNTSGIIGPVLTGLLIENTGSYLSAFVVSAAIVGFGGIWWWVALPRVERLRLDTRRLATL